MKNDYKKW